MAEVWTTQTRPSLRDGGDRLTTPISSCNSKRPRLLEACEGATEVIWRAGVYNLGGPDPTVTSEAGSREGWSGMRMPSATWACKRGGWELWCICVAGLCVGGRSLTWVL